MLFTNKQLFVDFTVSFTIRVNFCVGKSRGRFLCLIHFLNLTFLHAFKDARLPLLTTFIITWTYSVFFSVVSACVKFQARELKNLCVVTIVETQKRKKVLWHVAKWRLWMFSYQSVESGRWTYAPYLDYRSGDDDRLNRGVCSAKYEWSLPQS